MYVLTWITFWQEWLRNSRILSFTNVKNSTTYVEINASSSKRKLQIFLFYRKQNKNYQVPLKRLRLPLKCINKIVQLGRIFLLQWLKNNSTFSFTNMKIHARCFPRFLKIKFLLERYNKNFRSFTERITQLSASTATNVCH